MNFEYYIVTTGFLFFIIAGIWGGIWLIIDLIRNRKEKTIE